MGGYGTVYRARRSTAGGLTRPVALKVLRPGAADAETIARLKDEARLLSMISHRAIIVVHDFVELSIGWAIVLEFVHGMDLGEVTGQTRIPLGPVLEIVSEVTSALREAWEGEVEGQPLGLVHRDIKPPNILLSVTGDVKLLDFGIANSLTQEGLAQTQSGELVGTLSYIAPERFEGVCGPESDIYSLGLVFLELLGQRHRGSVQGRTRIIEAIAAIRQEHGEPVADLIEGMVAWEPAHRPSAEQVESRCRSLRAPSNGPSLGDWARANVTELLDTRTVLAEPMDPLVGQVITARMGMGGPSRRRLGLPVALGLALLVALVPLAFATGSLITGSVFWASDGPAAEYHLTSLLELTQMPDDAYCPDISDDGTRIVYTAGDDVFLHPIGGAAKNLTQGTDEEAWCPVFSPGADKIAFRVGDHIEIRSSSGPLLTTLDLAATPRDWSSRGLLLMRKTEVLWLADEHAEPVSLGQGPSWGEVSWYGDLAMVAGVSTLHLVDLQGNVEETDFEAFSAEALPDGETLLIADFDGRNSRLLTLREGLPPRVHTQLAGAVPRLRLAADASRVLLRTRPSSEYLELLDLDPITRTLKARRKLPTIPARVYVALSPEGSALLSYEVSSDANPGARGVQGMATVFKTTLDGEHIEEVTHAAVYHADLDSVSHGVVHSYVFSGLYAGHLMSFDVAHPGPSRTSLELDPRVVEGIAVSPDGDRAAVVDRDGVLHILSMGQGRVTDLGPGAEVHVNAMIWLDSGRLVASQASGTLILIDPDTLEFTSLSVRGEPLQGFPDGSVLVEDGSQLVWLDLNTGERRVLADLHPKSRVNASLSKDGTKLLLAYEIKQSVHYIADLELR